MEYDKPSDVSFGTLRQMAGDFAALTEALETDLLEYSQAFGELSRALRETRAIIRRHVGPLERDERETLFHFQLRLAEDTAKAALKLHRDLNRVLVKLPGRRRKRGRSCDNSLE